MHSMKMTATKKNGRGATASTANTILLPASG